MRKMACPFSRGLFKAGCNEEATVDEDRRRSTRIRRDERFKPLRQSSVQITSSLLGEESDDVEDTQTLNLKHLRAAVLVLTNPSRRVPKYGPHEISHESNNFGKEGTFKGSRSGTLEKVNSNGYGMKL